MLHEPAGRGQNYQARGHSFSLYGLTLSRTMTFLSILPTKKNGLQVGLFTDRYH